jgi:hypothetical protein
MTMATLTLKLPASTRQQDSSPRRGFWSRVFDAMIEARMRQAQQEIERHRRLISTDPVKDAGYRVGLRDVGALPFVR